MLCQIRSCRASTIAATRASPAYGCPLPLTVICVLNNLPRFRTQCHEPSKDLGLHGREVRPQDEKRIWSAHGFPTASSRPPHGFPMASSSLTASPRPHHRSIIAASPQHLSGTQRCMHRCVPLSTQRCIHRCVLLNEYTTMHACVYQHM